MQTMNEWSNILPKSSQARKKPPPPPPPPPPDKLLFWPRKKRFGNSTLWTGMGLSHFVHTSRSCSCHLQRCLPQPTISRVFLFFYWPSHFHCTQWILLTSSFAECFFFFFFLRMCLHNTIISPKRLNGCKFQLLMLVAWIHSIEFIRYS